VSSVAKESWEARGSRRRSRRNITHPLHACMVVCVGSTDRQRSGTCASDESQGQSCCIYGSLHLHVHVRLCLSCAAQGNCRIWRLRRVGSCSQSRREQSCTIHLTLSIYESICRSSIVLKLNLHLKFNLIACSRPVS
jgi:hypothetical protein